MDTGERAGTLATTGPTHKGLVTHGVSPFSQETEP